jgi:hypothetical protein
MRSFGSAGEFGAAALGELGGAVLSPESWLGAGVKGASWLGRAGKAALQQGAITGAADPIIQGLNIQAGAQDAYDRPAPAWPSARALCSAAACIRPRRRSATSAPARLLPVK